MTDALYANSSADEKSAVAANIGSTCCGFMFISFFAVLGFRRSNPPTKYK